jgi:hypothetical protein
LPPGKLRPPASLRDRRGDQSTANSACKTVRKYRSLTDDNEITPEAAHRHRTRGVSDAAAVCSAVIGDIAESPAASEADRSANPDDVFRRLSSA